MGGSAQTRLSSLKIAGIRGIGNHEINLSRFADVTILEGPNGLGKTSIIGGLTLALTGKLRTRAHWISPQDIRHRDKDGKHVGPGYVESCFSSSSNSESRLSWRVSDEEPDGRWAPEGLESLVASQVSDYGRVGSRFRLTHLLPQGWGGRFQDLKLKDRQRVLLEQMQISDLRKGLDSLGGNHRVGRAISSELEKLQGRVDKAESRLTAWRSAVGRWEDAKQRSQPLDLKPYSAVTSELREIATDLGRDGKKIEEREIAAFVEGRLTWIEEQISQETAVCSKASKMLAEWAELDVAYKHNQEVLQECSESLSEVLKPVREARDRLANILQEKEEELDAHQQRYEAADEAARQAERDLTAAHKAAGELVAILSNIREQHIGTTPSGHDECPVCLSTFPEDELSVIIGNRLEQLESADLEDLEERKRTTASQLESTKDEFNTCKRTFKQLGTEVNALNQLLTDGADVDSSIIGLLKKSPRNGVVFKVVEAEDVAIAKSAYSKAQSEVAATKEAVENVLESWKEVGFEGEPNADQISAREAELSKYRGQLADKRPLVNSLVKQLERHRSLGLAKDAWQSLVTAAGELSSGTLKASPDTPNSEWIDSITSTLAEVVDETRATFERFRTNTERLQRIKEEIGEQLASIDATLVEEIKPMIRAFLRAMAPGLPERVDLRALKTGTKIEADSNPADETFSEGELNALSLAILFSMHVYFDWCGWRGLVLDDPFLSTDVVRVSALLDVLTGLVSEHGSQILLTTHDADHADWCARRMNQAGLSVAHYSLAHGRRGVDTSLRWYDAANSRS